nr:immunoglobulin light chain junction region [Homo sapiens]
AGLLLISGLQS